MTHVAATHAAPVALVTGSCHRLGAHIAARLGEAGYRIALHASRASEPDGWLIERLDRAGVAWDVMVADLADAGQVAALIPQTAARFGARITLLVNNASHFGTFDGTDPDMSSLVEHFRINTAAPFVLASAMARQVDLDDRDGRMAVVNILDQRIAHPPADQLAYTLSKQALGEVTRALAATLAPRVRVNAVAPGLTIPTPDYSVEQLEKLADMMPLGRLPTPQDVAESVVYLATAQSTTGQVIFVDGGAAMRRFDRDFIHLGT